MTGPEDKPFPPRALLVFVDGRPVSFDEFHAIEPGEPYGYYRGERTRGVIVRCPPPHSCREVAFVLDSASLRAELLARRLRAHPFWAADLALALALAAVLVFLGLRPPRGYGLPALAIVLLGLVWMAGRLHATPLALPVLVLEVVALGAPALVSVQHSLGARAERLWRDAATQRGPRGALIRAVALGVTCVAVAVPHVVSGRSWYPASLDDSMLYLYGASRLLASGSLLHGLADGSRWVYSAYPALVAATARLGGVHPMIAYRWLGYLGAALMPAALAVFAYAITRRFRAAVLAAIVGGLWGGLAGYLWFAQEGLPRLLEGTRSLVIPEDYFEPRFLGEYRGPHSELVSYLCRVPWYPREAGLVLFWPALAILYTGLPRPGLRRLLAFSVLVVLSAAVYPYYGIPGAMVFALVGAGEAGKAARQRRFGRMAAIVVAGAAFGTVLFAIADRLTRAHRFPAGVLAYAGELWSNPTATLFSHPSLEFRITELLGSHFFMIACGLAALALARRHGDGGWAAHPLLRAVREWPGLPLFSTGLGLTLAAGALTALVPRTRALLGPYAWIVPWRTLVTPVLVTATAVALSLVLDELGRRRRLVLAALVLAVPMLSPLHWAFNADAYLTALAGQPVGRGRNCALYENYARYGAEILGRVVVREPFLTPPDPARYARAAFGVDSALPDRPYDALVEGEPPEVLLRLIAEGVVADVAVQPGTRFARAALEAGACRQVGAYGEFVILRCSP
jgi:hypothetical protein